MSFQESSQDDFIRKVVETVRSGYGIVPFIGSGASASSGILMGMEFTEYLTYCVWRSVEKGDNDELLNIAVQGWPSMPTRSEVNAATEWVIREFDKICIGYHVETHYDPPHKLKRLVMENSPDAAEADRMASAMQRPLVPAILFKPNHTKVDDEQVKGYHRAVASDHARQREPMNPDASPTSREYVVETAIRSLHDWRAMLNFLSRLRRRMHLKHPVLEEPNQALVDSFNSHITRGRRPNFTHTMFGHLAMRWRTQIFLTTNFDTLIEDALEALHESYEVIPVSLRDPLPHPDTVHSQRCIIKLHGSRTETRADHSLDHMPTDEDRKRFFHYVRGRFPDTSPGQGFLPSQLFVCGYSAKDMRCVQMIKHLLDNDRETLVFWICFSDDDIECLNVLFSKGYEKNFVVIRSDRPDLLLYDIYQKLTLCLPRGGVSYQYAEDSPPEAFESKSTIGGKAPPPLSKIAIQISELLKAKWPQPTTKPECIPCQVVCVEGEIGVTNPLRQVFLQRTKAGNMQGVWLEMEDFVDVGHVAHELLQLISLRRGRYQLDHAVFPSVRHNSRLKVDEEWKAQWEKLLKEWNIEPQYWLIVFHGRNGAGSCAGWFDGIWGAANGNGDTAAKRGAIYRISHDFMDMLGSLGFRVIYAPYTLCRWNQEITAHKWFDANLKRFSPPVEEAYTMRSSFLKSPASSHCAISHQLTEGKLDEELIQEIEIDIKSRAKGRHGQKQWIRFHANPTDSTARSFESIIENIVPRWLGFSDGGETTPSAETDLESVRRCAERRRKFIYAFSLFRQARHFSALLSEALIECSFPFNTEGVDNDWMRDQVVHKWLMELGDIGFLFLKPGGYVWMHRDVRHALQVIAEHGEKYSQDSHGGVAYPFQRRATNHYFIANWYGRAFNTTGHAQPFLEALYHYFQCIRWAPHSLSKAKGINLLPYRHGHIRVALNWIIKLLRMGQRSLEFWIQAPMADAWFGTEVCEKVIRQIKSAYLACNLDYATSKRLKNTLPDWLNTACGLLQVEMATINATLHNKPVYDFPHYVAFAQSGLERLKKTGDWLSSPRIVVSCSPTDSSDSKSELNNNTWLESVRKSLEAVLKENTIETKMLLNLIEDVLKDKPAPNGRLEEHVRQWRMAHWHWCEQPAGKEKQADPDVGPLMVTECLTELAYGYVKLAKLEEHAAKTPNIMLSSKRAADAKQKEETRKLWSKVSALCHATLMLGPHVHPNCIHAEMLQRVKSLTLYGLSLGRLGRFFEAHRRLNEANALLSKSDFARDPLQMAIIEIRRAEVHLLESRMIAEFWDEVFCSGIKQADLGTAIMRLHGTPLAGKSWLDVYLGIKPDHSLPSYKNNDSVIERDSDRLLRLHYAKLDEAWATLETAEKYLSGQTHASLWWTRLWALQMRTFAEHHPKWLHCESPSYESSMPAVRTLAFRQKRNRVDQVVALFRKAMTCSTTDEDYQYWITRQLDYFLRAFATAWLVDYDKESSDGGIPNASRFIKRLSSEVASAINGLKMSQQIWFCKKASSPVPGLYQQYRDKILDGDVSFYQYSRKHLPVKSKHHGEKIKSMVQVLKDALNEAKKQIQKKDTRSVS